jgi:hypothetical protein
MRDGSRVTTREDWFVRRRPELLRLFEHYMYGYAPAAPALEFRVESTPAPVLGGRATCKLVTIEFCEHEAPPIELLLLLPRPQRGPVPVFLGINFAGNHTLLADAALPEARCHQLEVHARAARGSAASAWSVEQIIERGYALASFHTCDVKPDRPRPEEGIQRYFSAAAAPDPQGWAALRAWAWACSRVVDYLQSDASVDASRIAVVGHSRMGKAVLVAGAYDERIALTISLQSGCGGAAPSRSRVGESVRQITQAFPHWFNGEFAKFAAEPARLPFDQHCLAALVAPRALLLANASEDTWANPVGQFEMLRAAHPVYRLLGVSGLESERMPAVGELTAGKLGYFLRAGTHSMTGEDWSAFLRFAERHLRAAGSRR